jgi:peptidoglycan-associated lipoprotein
MKRRKKMQRKMWICLALLLVVPGLLLTTSCAKKVGVQPGSGTATPADGPEGPGATDSGDGGGDVAQQQFLTEYVYFAFDSSALDDDARRVLNRKADYLNANAGANVLIEGHCDERGTPEYNLALGERRAQSAKDYLVNMGIDAARLSTVSYGEERPIDMGSGEEAWAKNRRAQFVLE